MKRGDVKLLLYPPGPPATLVARKQGAEPMRGRPVDVLRWIEMVQRKNESGALFYPRGADREPVEVTVGGPLARPGEDGFTVVVEPVDRAERLEPPKLAGVA